MQKPEKCSENVQDTKNNHKVYTIKSCCNNSTLFPFTNIFMHIKRIIVLSTSQFKLIYNISTLAGTNVAYRKPVNQSSTTRAGPANYANDGKPGNQNPDGQECSETQKEASPYWRVDLLAPQTVRVVRITTRGCCGHQPLQDLEIRVGNSSTDLQRNPLCAWNPGTLDEGITKTFTCARPLIGQYVAVQLVGVEGSLSLCEVEVFSNDGKFNNI